MRKSTSQTFLIRNNFFFFCFGTNILGNFNPGFCSVIEYPFVHWMEKLTDKHKLKFNTPRFDDDVTAAAAVGDDDDSSPN